MHTSSKIEMLELLVNYTESYFSLGNKVIAKLLNIFFII